MAMGKIFGSMLGFMTAGPMGAWMGGLWGESYDRNVQDWDRHLRDWTQLWQGWTPHWSLQFNVQPQQDERFLRTLFSACGELLRQQSGPAQSAQAFAKRLIRHFQLQDRQRDQALHWFNSKIDGDLQSLVQSTAQDFRASPLHRQFILNVLVQAAHLHGEPAAATWHLLRQWARDLDLSTLEFEQLVWEFRQRWQDSQGSQAELGLNDAYRLLGVPQDADFGTVKRAYRRLMSQFHPDKHCAADISETDRQAAKEKAQLVRAAYERIRRTQWTPA